MHSELDNAHKCTKFVFGQGFAPDSAAGVYCASHWAYSLPRFRSLLLREWEWRGIERERKIRGEEIEKGGGTSHLFVTQLHPLHVKEGI